MSPPSRRVATESDDGGGKRSKRSRRKIVPPGGARNEGTDSDDDECGAGNRNDSNKNNAVRSKRRRRRNDTSYPTATAIGKPVREDYDDAEEEEIHNDDDASDVVVRDILRGLRDRADIKTKEWFTNYVKGTEWIGCKTPVVRRVVRDVMERVHNKNRKNRHEQERQRDDERDYEAGIRLLQRNECDAKLAGMMILSEYYPASKLSALETLQDLERRVLVPGHVSDWSSSDWFSLRVLRPIVFYNPDDRRKSTKRQRQRTGKNADEMESSSATPTEGTDVDVDHRHHHHVVQYVLDFAKRRDTNLWHRRCGVVPFAQQYPKHRDVLPPDIGRRVADACDACMEISSEERFTQTGAAWVLRYALLQTARDENEYAMEIVMKHGDTWTPEAKKSLAEKLSNRHPWRNKILRLGEEKNAPATKLR